MSCNSYENLKTDGNGVRSFSALVAESISDAFPTEVCFGNLQSHVFETATALHQHEAAECKTSAYQSHNKRFMALSMTVTR